MRGLRWIEGIGTGRVRLAGSLAAGWAMLVLVLVTGRPVRRARGQRRERELSKTGEAKGKCEDWEGTANERRWTRMDTSTGPAGRDGSVVVPPASYRMLRNPDVVPLTGPGALPNLDCMTIGIVILILLLALALGIRHLQRTFFYPRPRPMPDIVDQEIDAVLVSFETTLKTHAPDVLSALNPGLSNETIREIESKYRLRLTNDLRALYRWRNGSSGEDFVELIPGHRFLPLEETAQQRAGDREQLLAEPLVQRVAFGCGASEKLVHDPG